MDNNFGLITKVLRFYKEENGEWYVDLPEYLEGGGNKEELQMVLGADDLLNSMCADDDTVYLKVSSLPLENCVQLDKLQDIDVPDEFKGISGAFYDVDVTENNIFINKTIWLCDVLKYVFEGDFPETIYYRKHVNHN